MTLAAVATGLTAPSAAHHGSFAAFDSSKTVTLSGIVEIFEGAIRISGFMCWYPAGRHRPNLLEMAGTSGAVRLGWNPHGIGPGDKITFSMHPVRNGRNGVLLLGSVLPDGRKRAGERLPRGENWPQL